MRTRSVTAWAKEKGSRKCLVAAASVIYRWGEHSYHYGPLALTEDDYDAAMAALSPPYHLPAMGMKKDK